MTKAYYVTNTLVLDIKPCPFCGSTNTNLMTMDGNHRAHCEDCYAIGPKSKIYQARDGDAILEWNRRRGEKQ